MVEQASDPFYHHEQTMDFDPILPKLFLGSFPRSTRDIDLLKARGVTAVLNVQTDGDLQMHGVNWQALRAHYNLVGLEVRRVQIEDLNDADLRDKLQQAADELASLIDAGHTVYIHCSGGMNRSPSVVICYLHWHQGYTLEEAAEHVRNRRTCAPVMEAIRGALWDQQRS